MILSDNTTTMEEETPPLDVIVIWDIENCKIPPNFTAWTVLEFIQLEIARMTLKRVHIAQTYISLPYNHAWDRKLSDLHDLGVFCVQYQKIGGADSVLMRLMESTYHLHRLSPRKPIIVLISGDCDFAPLFFKMKSGGFLVYGFYNEFAKLMMKKSFTGSTAWSKLEEPEESDHLPLDVPSLKTAIPTIATNTPAVSMQRHISLESNSDLISEDHSVTSSFSSLTGSSVKVFGNPAKLLHIALFHIRQSYNEYGMHLAVKPGEGIGSLSALKSKSGRDNAIAVPTKKLLRVQWIVNSLASLDNDKISLFTAPMSSDWTGKHLVALRKSKFFDDFCQLHKAVILVSRESISIATADYAIDGIVEHTAEEIHVLFITKFSSKSLDFSLQRDLVSYVTSPGVQQTLFHNYGCLIEVTNVKRKGSAVDAIVYSIAVDSVDYAPEAIRWINNTPGQAVIPPSPSKRPQYRKSEKAEEKKELSGADGSDTTIQVSHSIRGPHCREFIEFLTIFEDIFVEAMKHKFRVKLRLIQQQQQGNSESRITRDPATKYLNRFIVHDPTPGVTCRVVQSDKANEFFMPLAPTCIALIRRSKQTWTQLNTVCSSIDSNSRLYVESLDGDCSIAITTRSVDCLVAFATIIRHVLGIGDSTDIVDDLSRLLISKKASEKSLNQASNQDGNESSNEGPMHGVMLSGTSLGCKLALKCLIHCQECLAIRVLSLQNTPIGSFKFSTVQSIIKIARDNPSCLVENANGSERCNRVYVRPAEVEASTLNRSSSGTLIGVQRPFVHENDADISPSTPVLADPFTQLNENCIVLKLEVTNCTSIIAYCLSPTQPTFCGIFEYFFQFDKIMEECNIQRNNETGACWIKSLTNRRQEVWQEFATIPSTFFDNLRSNQDTFIQETLIVDLRITSSGQNTSLISLLGSHADILQATRRLQTSK